jgi:dipeptidyl-peptidase-4
MREHPGRGQVDPAQFVRRVPESKSPVERHFVQSADGMYAAVAVRKPTGAGPFPAVVYFHGSPGGQGMETMALWSSGSTGAPLWERLLQEGYVVAVADYRKAVDGSRALIRTDRITYVDDGQAVVEYVKKLPYVRGDRIGVYGVSLGANLVLHLIHRQIVAAAILGAPSVVSFLGVPPQYSQAQTGPLQERIERLAKVPIDEAYVSRMIEPIRTPLLIFVGGKDERVGITRVLYQRLRAQDKVARLEVYADGYHDFVIGPQGKGTDADRPVLSSTLQALEDTVRFFASHLK